MAEPFTIIWNYNGRDVPIEVAGSTDDEDDQFIEAVAEFLWRNRHLADKVQSTGEQSRPT